MDTRCIEVQRWGSATREAGKERRGRGGVESSSAASALWRSNIQTSRSFAVCQILSSAPIGARVPLILLRRLFLHLLLWSRSKSTLPPPPPLHQVSLSLSLSLSPLHRRYQSAHVADWCQCWLVLQVTMTSLPLFLSPIYLYFSLSLSPYFRVYLAFWLDPLDSDVYTKTHGWGRERERETCRSILCAATTRSHPSPRRAATMNPWIDCSLFTLEHSHIMVGPPLDVVDYPLSSKLNLSDCSQAVRMISHRSCSHRMVLFSIEVLRSAGFLVFSLYKWKEDVYSRAIEFFFFFFFFWNRNWTNPLKGSSHITYEYL